MASKEPQVCANPECRSRIADGDSVDCYHCNNTYHYGCSGLSRNTHRTRQQKEDWKCPIMCRKKKGIDGEVSSQRSTSTLSLCVGDNELLDRLGRIESKLETDWGKLEQRLEAKLEQLADKLLEKVEHYISSKFKEVKESVACVELKLQQAEATVETLKSKIERLEKKFGDMELTGHMQDQYNRSSNLIVSGVDQQPEEDILERLREVLAKTNYTLNKEEISIAHRLPSSKVPAPIVVQFKSKRVRSEVLQAAKKLKDPRDDLDVRVRKPNAAANKNCFTRFLKRAWERMSGSTSSEEAEYPEFVDPQNEVEETTTEPRYRPNSLRGLCHGTHFTETELKRIYRNLKAECPSGVIGQEAFKSIYSKFFPSGALMTNLYAQHVFNSFDLNRTGYLNFENLIHGLSTLLRGSFDEKLRWVFCLYDIKRDGVLTRDEVSNIVGSVFELSGCKISEPSSPETQIAINERVDIIFQKMDLNKDGIVTLDEFLSSCKSDESIRRSLTAFHSVF